MPNPIEKVKNVPVINTPSDDLDNRVIAVLEKPKGLARFRPDWLSVILVFVLTVVFVLVALALLGPVIGNTIYTNIVYFI